MGPQVRHHPTLVGPLEQQVHSFLELLPVMGVSFVTILYWDQFLALFGLGEDAAVRISFQRSSLALGYLVACSAAIGLFIVLPFARMHGDA